MSDQRIKNYEECIAGCVESFGIELVDCEVDKRHIEANGVDYYINKSYLVGADQIILGIYDDPHLRMASFLHEVGHMQVDHNIGFAKYGMTAGYSQILDEAAAWHIGFCVGKNHDIDFDEYVYKWAEKQVLSYCQKDGE